MSDKLISLADLYKVVADKISAQEAGSYSYEIAKAGLEKSTRKVGEEALEVVIASFLDEKEQSDKTHQDLVGEIADLYYHSLILMAQRGVKFEEVLAELTKRNSKK